MIPFLKWPGGKRWFVTNYSYFLPSNFNRYIEPFLGGGSVFFYIKPNKSILSDLNGELITTYEVIRDCWTELSARLRIHHRKHCAEYYYVMRKSSPQSPVNRAARFIYLNRTCFNGIYRVNQHGKFNVPKGSKDSVIRKSDDFQNAAKLLKKADIRISDFEAVIDEAKSGDLVYADPPYTVLHNVNGFIKYNELLFTWKDQLRLAEALVRARKRGAKIVSTNANHHSIQELYRTRGFSLKTISRYSSISAASRSRKQFEELLIRST